MADDTAAGDGSKAGCIFCAIVAGDAPSRQIYEDERTLAFLDIHPVTVGHSLVIPKRHATDVHDISADDMAAVARTSKIVAAMLVDRLGSDGVNLLNASGQAAWQTVFHFHMHVIPRIAGDLPFPFPHRGASEKDLQQVFERVMLTGG